MFSHAADERVAQARTAVSGRDDKINVGPAGCGADFVYCGTRENFRLNGDTAQKIHPLECVHFLPGCFFHCFGQSGETDAGVVNEHVICIGIHRVEEAQGGAKRLR